MTVSTNLPALSATERSILQSDHMTATLTTRSGSRYTVVARPAVGVVVIHDRDGWACVGTSLWISREGRLFLRDDENDKTLVRTTPITSCYVLSN